MKLQADIVTMSLEQVEETYQTPLLELVFQAAQVHRQHHDPSEIQVCSLLSIKTGGCSEDCAYCPQSAHYKTDTDKQALLTVEEVVVAASDAKQKGSSRFCMGAAWREVKDGEEFERVLEMVESVAALDLEVCCTLGMLTSEQADKLKAKGLTAYNHNLDSSEDFYSEIISTRSYQDRLETLANVRRAGISVCSGGILGMGESLKDRIKLLHTLATLPEQPESVPINSLVAIEGTPLENQEQVTAFEMVRTIATARILMPHAKVRLSAGRLDMSAETQALCFLAGANSIFSGETLLTTANNNISADVRLFQALDLKAAKI